MNISSKLNFVRNTKRIKNLLLVHNMCNTSHLSNDLNERPFAANKSTVNRNTNLFKPLLTLNRSLSTQPFDASNYERIADQTLEHLYEEFDTIIETNIEFKDSDLSLSNGVITWNLGLHGIYVINKQTPNRQIWFSSPFSGPKRYDLMNNQWIYKRDSISLFSTLSSELSNILKREIKIKDLNL